MLPCGHICLGCTYAFVCWTGRVKWRFQRTCLNQNKAFKNWGIHIVGVQSSKSYGPIRRYSTNQPLVELRFLNKSKSKICSGPAPGCVSISHEWLLCPLQSRSSCGLCLTLNSCCPASCLHTESPCVAGLSSGNNEHPWFWIAGGSPAPTVWCSAGVAGGTGPVPAGTLQREERRSEHGAASARYEAHLRTCARGSCPVPTGLGSLSSGPGWGGQVQLCSLNQLGHLVLHGPRNQHLHSSLLGPVGTGGVF
jgi:hypothetical protein